MSESLEEWAAQLGEVVSEAISARKQEEGKRAHQIFLLREKWDGVVRGHLSKLACVYWGEEDPSIVFTSWLHVEPFYQGTSFMEWKLSCSHSVPKGKHEHAVFERFKVTLRFSFDEQGELIPAMFEVGAIGWDWMGRADESGRVTYLVGPIGYRDEEIEAEAEVTVPDFREALTKLCQKAPRSKWSFK